MTVWTQMQPAYAGNMWNEALNKRLGTQVRELSHSSNTHHIPYKKNVMIYSINLIISWLLGKFTISTKEA